MLVVVVAVVMPVNGEPLDDDPLGTAPGFAFVLALVAEFVVLGERRMAGSERLETRPAGLLPAELVPVELLPAESLPVEPVPPEPVI